MAVSIPENGENYVFGEGSSVSRNDLEIPEMSGLKLVTFRDKRSSQVFFRIQTSREALELLVEELRQSGVKVKYSSEFDSWEFPITRGVLLPNDGERRSLL